MSSKGRHYLTIDPEFTELICPHTTAERRRLETSLLRDGCLEPIVVWSDTIVDGHDRYEICTAYGIPFPVAEKEFSCREEAAAWFCARQLSRRDLPSGARKYLIGIQFDFERAANERKKRAERGRHGGCPSPVPDAEGGKTPAERQPCGSPGCVTAKRIARENGIAPGTVWKYASYAKTVNEIREKVPAILPAILSGRYKISHENLLEMAELTPDEIRKVICGLKTKQAGSPRYQYTARNAAGRNRDDGAAGVSVKDMPGFDPDAEATGLTLTIPSWVSSLERCRTKSRLEWTSPGARKKLCSALSELSQKAEELKTEIGGAFNE